MSESFDGAQDERRGFDIIEDFPFMLRLSKHSEPLFSNLLEGQKLFTLCALSKERSMERKNYHGRF
jgi:hypothetical protein